MAQKSIPNIHPGEILREEFLKPMNITPYLLAKSTYVPATRISEIIKGRRRISADTALRLGKFLGTSAEFWLGLQMEYDLREEKKYKMREIQRIKTFK